MEEPAVTVGRIAKAHGVHGEVAVENRSDNPDRWVPGAVVFDEDGRSYTVRTVRPHGPRLLVTFDEVEDQVAFTKRHHQSAHPFNQEVIWHS